MNADGVSRSTIYPAYAFKRSPTWFTWVKLTIADIHGLREEAGFEGQNLYFHLNHPIRYVSLVAPVTAIEDMMGKYVLITIDDGSGSTIVVKIKRLAVEIATAIDCPSNTAVSNVNVLVELGSFDVQIDGTTLDIGTVIKVKGTIELFRGIKQLDLRRASVVSTTAEEIKAWNDIAEFKAILSTPWVVTEAELEALRQEIATEKKNSQDAETSHTERLKRHMERKKEREQARRRRDVKLEAKRRKEEEVMNAGALV